MQKILNTPLKVTEWNSRNSLYANWNIFGVINFGLSFLRCYDNKSNSIMKRKQKKKKYIIFRKPLSKYVAPFQLSCLPMPKRQKESQKATRWSCLFFSVNEHVLLSIIQQDLPLICLLMHELVPFSHNFVKDSLVHLQWYPWIRTRISLPAKKFRHSLF